MNDEQNKEKRDNNAKLGLLFSLINKKNSILKKYRKKFEELKINQIRKGVDGNTD